MLEHKSGNIISLKHIMIEEKLHMEGLRNLPTFFRMEPSPPLRPPVPQDWGFATSTQNSNRYYLRNAKATNFKFGQNNNRVHPNKSLLELLEKRESGRIQGLPNFFWVPLLSHEREKLLISNLASIFRGSIRTSMSLTRRGPTAAKQVLPPEGRS